MADLTPVGHEQADQAVATRFTRLMKATTSRWGVLTDPPIIAIATGIFLLASLGAARGGAPDAAVRALVVLMALPIVVGVATFVALGRARRDVVEWMAKLPFRFENMNAVLNGLGEALDVEFAGEVPPVASVNAALDRVHSDCFVTKGADEGDPQRLEVRIGIVDSKRNPAATNHQRYARVVALCEQVLVPLSKTHPIVEVRVK